MCFSYGSNKNHFILLNPFSEDTDSAFVQYNFKGEHTFKLLAHGNAESKHITPYQSIKESTKAHLGLNLKDNTPHEAF